MYVKLLEKIKKAETKAEILVILKPLKKIDLKRIIELANIPISLNNKDKGFLESKIVNWFGNKIDANIILNIDLEE